MRLSARTVTGLRALVALARSGNGGLTLSALAERSGAPAAYLAKLVAPLKAAGLVGSTRGFRGGVSLAAHPSRIAAGRVLDALEGPLLEREPAAGSGDPAVEALRAGLEGAMRAWLEGVTLEDLAARPGLDDWTI